MNQIGRALYHITTGHWSFFGSRHAANDAVTAKTAKFNKRFSHFANRRKVELQLH
jgi:hypothetical protein